MSLLVPATAYPTYVGCDFKVISSKPTADLNVMTTMDGKVMGAVPSDDSSLATASTAVFTEGSEVRIALSSVFDGQGFAHATAGTFTAPQFNASAANEAEPCVGPATMVYKDLLGSVDAIVWTAPGSLSALDNVTLSFAAARTYGKVQRHTIVLTRSSALTTTSTAEVSTTAEVTGTTTVPLSDNMTTSMAELANVSTTRDLLSGATGAVASVTGLCAALAAAL